MKFSIIFFLISFQSLFAATIPLNPCDTGNPNDQMVKVGDWCIDKFESVICQSKTKDKQQLRHSCYSVENEPQVKIDDKINLRGTILIKGYQAYSMANMKPARNLNYYQALAACIAAGKRLIPDPVWVGAALGTPDPFFNENSKCNFKDEKIRKSNQAGALGDKLACRSQWGVEDMIGNVWEWTAMTVPIRAQVGVVNQKPDKELISLIVPDIPPDNTRRTVGNYHSGAARGGSTTWERAASFHSVEFGISPERKGAALGFRCGKIAR